MRRRYALAFHLNNIFVVALNGISLIDYFHQGASSNEEVHEMWPPLIVDDDHQLPPAMRKEAPAKEPQTIFDNYCLLFSEVYRVSFATPPLARMTPKIKVFRACNCPLLFNITSFLRK